MGIVLQTSLVSNSYAFLMVFSHVRKLPMVPQRSKIVGNHNHDFVTLMVTVKTQLFLKKGCLMLNNLMYLT